MKIEQSVSVASVPSCSIEVKKVLAVAAAAEALTGMGLLVYPSLVIRLLFGAEIVGASVVMSRITGIALIALGIACWPYAATSRALCGMLTYSTLATLYLGYVGLKGEFVGLLCGRQSCCMRC